jgi:diguanylate cyclase (GGDEF)-like protein
MQSVNMNFSIKSMDIIILVTIFFIFPNNWANTFFAAIVLILSFAIFCAFNTARFTQNNSYLAGAVYIAAAFCLNVFSSYRFNFYKRSQFYDNLMLHNLLNTDTLTGAFTRVKFDEEIKKQIAFSQQTGRKMSLAIFDIDNFKRINDTYGHLEGDNVLSGIANIVNQNMRPRDILTRWGGEEFVIVFPGTGLTSAVKTAERLRMTISDAEFNIGNTVTCSFGVTEFKKGDTPVSLLRRADKLLYEAKSSGKNIVCAI